jgi:hypothetical protein
MPGLFLIFVMWIGYRKIGKIIKIYLEDRTVYHFICLGNKRIKPDRIWKYGKRVVSVIKISEKRFIELEDEIKWIEIK